MAVGHSVHWSEGIQQRSAFTAVSSTALPSWSISVAEAGGWREVPATPAPSAGHQETAPWRWYIYWSKTHISIAAGWEYSINSSSPCNSMIIQKVAGSGEGEAFQCGQWRPEMAWVHASVLDKIWPPRQNVLPRKEPLMRWWHHRSTAIEDIRWCPKIETSYLSYILNKHHKHFYTALAHY